MKLIQAVIGVIHNGAETLYFKRSDKMENYPGVWSLLSIQFKDEELDQRTDPQSVQKLFDKLSEQRLNGTPLRVKRWLTAGSCNKNLMNARVVLHLYEVEVLGRLTLNPDFYTACGWYLPADYKALSTQQTCGLCVSLWSRWCVKNGLVSEGFAPEMELEE